MSQYIVHPDPELANLIPKYLQNRHNDVAQLERSITEENFEGIKLLSHRMKGSGGGYGFDKISEIGKLMEEAVDQKNIGLIKEQVAALKDYLENVKVVFD